MICRLWHGWTAAEDADAYESYLREELYPRIERELGDHGYRGHHVLRRARGDEVEFVTMTWFDSLDSVRGFAGEDYETPVITGTAAKLLAHYDSQAGHFDLAMSDRSPLRHRLRQPPARKLTPPKVSSGPAGSYLWARLRAAGTRRNTSGGDSESGFATRRRVVSPTGTSTQPPRWVWRFRQQSVDHLATAVRIRRTSRNLLRQTLGHMSSGSETEPTVFRVGGVSYLRIPADNPRRSAHFYEAVFGWRVRGDPDEPSFEDGSGHVIGHFMADLPVAGEAGVRPYIFVERVDETLDKVVSHGGEVVTAPYPEGDLWVATFRDPAGNVLGVWQTGSRASGES